MRWRAGRRQGSIGAARTGCMAGAFAPTHDEALGEAGEDEVLLPQLVRPEVLLVQTLREEVDVDIECHGDVDRRDDAERHRAAISYREPAVKLF